MNWHRAACLGVFRDGSLVLQCQAGRQRSLLSLVAYVLPQHNLCCHWWLMSFLNIVSAVTGGSCPSSTVSGVTDGLCPSSTQSLLSLVAYVLPQQSLLSLMAYVIHQHSLCCHWWLMSFLNTISAVTGGLGPSSTQSLLSQVA